MKDWFRNTTNTLGRNEVYVGSFSINLNGQQVYIHCFENKKGARRTKVVNCEMYPKSNWIDAYKRTKLYQLRIQPWEEWGKKDNGIYTYNQVMDPKEEFLAVLKGDATWEIKHDHS